MISVSESGTNSETINIYKNEKNRVTNDDYVRVRDDSGTG